MTSPDNRRFSGALAGRCSGPARKFNTSAGQCPLSVHSLRMVKAPDEVGGSEIASSRLCAI